MSITYDTSDTWVVLLKTSNQCAQFSLSHEASARVATHSSNRNQETEPKVGVGALSQNNSTVNAV